GRTDGVEVAIEIANRNAEACALVLRENGSHSEKQRHGVSRLGAFAVSDLDGELACLIADVCDATGRSPLGGLLGKLEHGADLALQRIFRTFPNGLNLPIGIGAPLPLGR